MLKIVIAAHSCLLVYIQGVYPFTENPLHTANIYVALLESYHLPRLHLSMR